jgi:hypothetical protein
MSEQHAAPSDLEVAKASYWRSSVLSVLMADVEPWGEDESFAIADLTDEEWEAFVDALQE